jgi:histidinol-phosphate aminotransferase
MAKLTAMYKKPADSTAFDRMNAPCSPAFIADPCDVAARVTATVRSEVRALTAYHVANAAGMIKLDANESPYALPDAVRARLGASLANVALNRYPDGGADAVKDALRKAHALPDAAGIVLGNGSDELLQLITTAVTMPGAAVVAPAPTFVMYRLYATYAGARYVPVSLQSDFALDTDAMLAAIERERPVLVWLASPNNPTGTQFDANGIERIVRATPGLAVVDEAYFAFAAHSFLPHVLEFPNLVVVRTLSKIGMAGLRLGYAVSHRAWIDEIDKVRSPYNLNSLTQAAAQFLLRDDRVFTEHAAAIRGERTRLMTALARLTGVSVFDSAANFFVARFPDGPLAFARLKSAGILVKNVHGWHPLLANCLRITVGTPAENDALLTALGQDR